MSIVLIANCGWPNRLGSSSVPTFEYHGGHGLRPIHYVRAAFGAELPRYRLVEIAAGKLLRRALVYLKPPGGISTNMLGEPL